MFSITSSIMMKSKLKKLKKIYIEEYIYIFIKWFLLKNLSQSENKSLNLQSIDKFLMSNFKQNRLRSQNLSRFEHGIVSYFLGDFRFSESTHIGPQCWIIWRVRARIYLVRKFVRFFSTQIHTPGQASLWANWSLQFRNGWG